MNDRPSLTIRTATPDDVTVILGFVRDLARFERAEHEVVADEAAILQTLFARGARAHAVIAEHDGHVVGFAVYFFSYSTWQGRNGLYLEDLYVTPAHRGNGTGKALLRHLARIALEKDCGRFEWSVLDWNETAINVYKQIGAKPQDEWIRYRLDGKALERLAES